MHSRNTFSLLTFSVSRIPFREDPPADIIPPPWADRSVVQRSYLAANSSKKYLKYSFSCQFMRVRKIFVQVGTFYNELNCSSSLTRVSGTVISDGPLFSGCERLAASVALKSFMSGAQVSRKSFCTFPKSGWLSYSVMVCDYDPAAFVTLPPSRWELYSFWYLVFFLNDILITS